MVLITKYNFEKKTQKVRHGKNTKKKGLPKFLGTEFPLCFQNNKERTKKNYYSENTRF